MSIIQDVGKSNNSDFSYSDSDLSCFPIPLISPIFPIIRKIVIIGISGIIGKIGIIGISGKKSEFDWENRNLPDPGYVYIV